MARNKKKHRPLNVGKVIVPRLTQPVTPLDLVPTTTINESMEEETPVTVNSSDKPLAADPLVDEVQSFLRQRQELAQRLADEIAATEAKLAELKKTAAMLFPENYPSPNGAKKVKKAKKAAGRIEKETPAASESHESLES